MKLLLNLEKQSLYSNLATKHQGFFVYWKPYLLQEVKRLRMRVLIMWNLRTQRRIEALLHFPKRISLLLGALLIRLTNTRPSLIFSPDNGTYKQAHKLQLV